MRTEGDSEGEFKDQEVEAQKKDSGPIQVGEYGRMCSTTKRKTEPGRQVAHSPLRL